MSSSPSSWSTHASYHNTASSSTSCADYQNILSSSYFELSYRSRSQDPCWSRRVRRILCKHADAIQNSILFMECGAFLHFGNAPPICHEPWCTSSGCIESVENTQDGLNLKDAVDELYFKFKNCHFLVLPMLFNGNVFYPKKVELLWLDVDTEFKPIASRLWRNEIHFVSLRLVSHGPVLIVHKVVNLPRRALRRPSNRYHDASSNYEWNRANRFHSLILEYHCMVSKHGHSTVVLVILDSIWKNSKKEEIWWNKIYQMLLVCFFLLDFFMPPSTIVCRKSTHWSAITTNERLLNSLWPRVWSVKTDASETLPHLWLLVSTKPTIETVLWVHKQTWISTMKKWFAVRPWRQLLDVRICAATSQQDRKNILAPALFFGN